MLINVAAIQMVSGKNIDKNFSIAEKLLEQARDKGAKLAVLPETFLTYGQKIKPDPQQQREFISIISTMAKRLNVWVVAGTYPLDADVLNHAIGTSYHKSIKPYAASLVFDWEGKLKSSYTKIHLFDVDVNDAKGRYRESDEYQYGDSVEVFNGLGCQFGLSVCYDLRFPELYIQLVKEGCKVIVVPSAFTEATGRAHWETLLRARAIESQCFIVAANQGGVHEKGRATWGHSMIVNPWGEVMSKLDKGEGVIVETLDLNSVDEIRAKMPIQQHRRLF